jgi:hypothetical protein
VPLLSTALAAAEAEMSGGRALVLGYIIGLRDRRRPRHRIEPGSLYARLARDLVDRHARLRGGRRAHHGLDLVQTRHALAIAASHASGLKENFGSMTKPYHAGHAARNGLLAAQLAREGMTASETALEGKQGYAAAFGGANGLAEAIESLGRRWQLIESGIAVKPYPSCALTHSAIDALIDLRTEHRLSARDVVSVHVGVTSVVPDVLAHLRPTNALERKFSMQYCAAAALAEGRVDFGSFADGEIANADTRELMGRVAMAIDPGLPQGVEQNAWSRVTVRLRDGRTLSTQPRGARGASRHAPLGHGAPRQVPGLRPHRDGVGRGGGRRRADRTSRGHSGHPGSDFATRRQPD